MTAERWRQIESLFAQAVSCSPSDRQALLDRVCVDDPELRRELESLLACDAPDQHLVEIPAIPPRDFAENAESDADLAGRRIGPYRLIRLIGHGGMGAVYLGVRDDDQYHKQVAIKLLKRGMDTDFMLSRFRQERQILANLEHPFVARLIDGGATEDGLPYFVMEYVDGIPITKYCAGKNLSVPERLRLFRLVCEAVQYAHQNLVVHRDLKPSNILTTKEGIPKLLDFGIAKVVDPNVSADMTATQREFRMLTPEYASPEQVRGLPISTASDTYSLGAVLYELLAGERPHRFTAASLFEIERTICEVEPEKPSVVATRKDGLPPNVRKQLGHQLSGDLDNIVLTAMHKEPQRRYASAGEFSEDLRRHLEGLPIVAQVDRWTYRAGKFIRRNRLAAGAAALVVLSLVGGIITTTFQARRAERRFELGRQLANSVLFDLNDQLEQVPGSMPARVAMVETVVQYLDNLAQDSGGDPTLDLEIAEAYVRVAALEGHPFHPNLGRTVLALEHTQKALVILERLVTLPETRAQAWREVVSTHIEAAIVEQALGNLAPAAAHLQRAAAIVVEVSSRYGLELEPGTQVSLYLRLADIESQRGDYQAELANVSKAVDIAQKWVESEPSLRALNTLRDAQAQFANVLVHVGELNRARDAFQLALQTSEQLLSLPDASDSNRYGLIGIYRLYGDLLGAPDDPNLGQPAEALRQYQEAASVGEAFAAREAQDASARRNLADSYCRIGLVLLENDPAEALNYYRRAVALSTEITEAEPKNIDHRSALVDSLLGAGQALFRLGKKQEAQQDLDRAIELQESIAAVAPGRIWLLRATSRAYMASGHLLLDQGDSSHALANYRTGLAAAEKSLQNAPGSLHLQMDRADLLEALGTYYLAVAARPGASSAHRAEWRTEARSWYQQGLAVWQDWMSRKVAVPYAERRLNQTLSILSSIQ